MAAGAVSLKNLTKREEVRKGADQAIYGIKLMHKTTVIWISNIIEKVSASTYISVLVWEQVFQNTYFWGVRI